jgi:hypothetical protein
MINSAKGTIAGFCIACCLLPVGCASAGSSHRQVRFQTVEQASVSASEIAGGIHVLRSETEWSNFWSILKASYLPQPPLPSLNFSENVVVALVDSPRTTGGYSITITHVLASGTGVTVRAVHQSPGPDCLVTQALEQPYHIVTTPVFSGEAIMNLTETVLDCSAP